MPTDATLTESSTVESVPVYNLEEMTPEQQGTFMKDGTVPTKAASAPATEPEAESAPGLGDASAPPAEPQETKPKTEARIQELLAQRREANIALDKERLEVARLKGILEGAKVQTSPSEPAKAAGEPLKRPKLDDFDTVAEWADAVTAFAEAAAEQKAQKVTESSKVQNAEEAAKQKIVDAFKGRIAAFKETTPDFEQVAFGESAMNPAMGLYILDSEKGPEVAYWLGKNPEEASRIAKLPDVRAAREMAFIEAKLNGVTPVTTPPKPKLSAAPAPSTELSGTAGTHPDEALAALNRGDMTSYLNIMNERDRAKKRR